MEISAISSTSYINKINWQQLTAKEIMNYDKQGVEVPDVYLQWAKDFITSVNATDNDETTYATAQAENLKESENIENNEDTSSINEDTDATNTDNVEDLSPAQKKRKELEENGISQISEAKIFRSDSKQAIVENFISRREISSISKQSDNEIAVLDNYMKNLISRIEVAQNEMKNNIDKINNNQSDKNTFDKINQIQNELNRYGIDGQNASAGAEQNLLIYNQQLNAQTPTISNGLDVGGVTVEVGNTLLSTATRGGIFDIIKRVIAHSTIKAGNGAINSSEKSLEVQTQAIQSNNTNQGRINSYQAEIQNRTGIESINVENNQEQANIEKENSTNEANNNNENQDNKITENKQESNNKVIKNDSKNELLEENDMSKPETRIEEDKINAGDLDYLLKRKIRRGENINPEA